MSLKGRAALALWNDLAPEVRSEFHYWHSREHVQEQMGLPGYLRARRYAAIGGVPEYFMLYELRAQGDLGQVPLRTGPSPLEARIEPYFFPRRRMACTIRSSRGGGVCGLVATVWLDTVPEDIGDDESRFDGYHLLVEDLRALLLLESWGDLEGFAAACQAQAGALGAEARIYRLQALHDGPETS
jgi:hypothetical protein